MNIHRFLFALALPVLSVGCAVDADTADEDVADDEANLHLAAPLVGTYVDDTGAFRRLELSAARTFSADIDTGIRCVRAPCPSSEHIEGRFVAGTRSVTLYSATASSSARHLLGRYSYVLQGNKLSLSRYRFEQSLERVDVVTCASRASVSECVSDPRCAPKFGPSSCSPDGRICTADMAYKGCFDKVEECSSDASCASNERCVVRACKAFCLEGQSGCCTPSRCEPR